MKVSASQLDERFMRMALSLAMRGTGKVSPNPRVGAVIVREGEVVGWGYHRAFGEPHAEVEALRRAGERARGSTVYVNLEPCSHFGKTPPCAPRLVAEGVERVVVGMTDPNPKVAGRGMAILEAAGIQVTRGVLEEECRWINRGFVSLQSRNRPWVTIKGATSADGCIALANGESRWITGPGARKRGHLLRAGNDAIMVGIGTVLADDPRLNVRSVSGRDPLIVVLDSRLDLGDRARVLEGGNVLVIGSEGASAQRRRMLEKVGARVWLTPGDRSGHPGLVAVLEHLASIGVCYLLVEGGAGVVSSFVGEALFDQIDLFQAPSLMGRGLSLTERVHFSGMEDAIRLRTVRIRQVDKDLWLEAVPECSRD